MIINCEHCENYNDCEYKGNYNRLQSRAVEFFRHADKDPSTHSYFSWNIKCDYWYPNKKDRDGGDSPNV